MANAKLKVEGEPVDFDHEIIGPEAVILDAAEPLAKMIDSLALYPAAGARCKKARKALDKALKHLDRALSDAR